MHKLELIYGSHNPQPAKQSSIFVLSCETISLGILVNQVDSADLGKHTLKTVRSKREKKTVRCAVNQLFQRSFEVVFSQQGRSCMISMQQRMAWWIKDSGYATSVAGKATIFCILMTIVHQIASSGWPCRCCKALSEPNTVQVPFQQDDPPALHDEPRGGVLHRIQ